VIQLPAVVFAHTALSQETEDQVYLLTFVLATPIVGAPLEFDIGRNVQRKAQRPHLVSVADDGLLRKDYCANPDKVSKSGAFR
jgi:hypothetical protein